MSPNATVTERPSIALTSHAPGPRRNPETSTAAQVDLLSLSFEKKPCPKYPWPELKLTIAPQLDLYGRFIGKDAQFQWPLQPNIEWHICEALSVVIQMSIPLFTIGGRNPPASFAVGILWHAKNPQEQGPR